MRKRDPVCSGTAASAGAGEGLRGAGVVSLKASGFDGISEHGVLHTAGDPILTETCTRTEAQTAELSDWRGRLWVQFHPNHTEGALWKSMAAMDMRPAWV
ncbi:hypothetical protein ANANG_G00257520 [Anguilla anguilla]|uniref:Uncharacterized protein n=1 Tax=Anguilla anguilla TaxID=7936 RepID=A0A9D3LRY6_ANGAN|nr:hypothetical protein ANANG_G00257520 [Anguilla anguilla]